MKSVYEKIIFENNRNIYENNQEQILPPNTNTREYKKERLIAALIKELGSSHDKPKRIRKIVNKYY